MSEKTKAANRPTRVPVAERNRLSFADKDPNYYYRLVNDEAGRVQTFLNAGYDFVEGDSQIGDSRAGEGSQLGSKITKDVGQGKVAYLMRIPLAFYNEDQERKIKQHNEMVSSGRRKTAAEFTTARLDIS